MRNVPVLVQGDRLDFLHDRAAIYDVDKFRRLGIQARYKTIEFRVTPPCQRRQEVCSDVERHRQFRGAGLNGGLQQ